MTDDLDLGLRHEEHDPPRSHRGDRPRYGRRRLAMGIVLLAVVAIIGGVAVGGVGLVHRIQAHFGSASDYSGPGSGSVTIQVHAGDSLAAIGNTLYKSGVVASVRAFTDAAQANAKSSTIGPGFYSLHKHMKASLAVTMLLDPSSLLQARITIPEGNRMRDIFARVVKNTDITMSALQDAAKDPAALGVPAWGQGHSLEGFLFPATYDFPPGTTAKQALTAMVTRFNQEAASLNLVAGAKAIGKTPYDVLTLASIIEREGRLDSDFPKIAEVFYNRLRIGMSLGSDATLYYVLPENNGPIRQSQLHLKSPYNTRDNPGLPPTPIASPGALALQAALHPAHGDYLYFVTIDKAGHAGFAKTDAEFQQLVAESRRNGVQ
ncbi:MAG TPA: endolytic transglycosylase MltG [Mycobacteriales bacterium]|nr:endolytic transglycosylase MltG [Mycobacteriales bacterium]